MWTLSLSWNHVPSVNREGEGLIICTAASQQGFGELPLLCIVVLLSRCRPLLVDPKHFYLSQHETQRAAGVEVMQCFHQSGTTGTNWCHSQRSTTFNTLFPSVSRRALRWRHQHAALPNATREHWHWAEKSAFINTSIKHQRHLKAVSQHRRTETWRQLQTSACIHEDSSSWESGRFQDVFQEFHLKFKRKSQ